LSRTGDEIRVHYLNWNEKFDSDICIDDVTLIPYTARTKEHRVTKMGSKKSSKLAKYQVFFVDPASSSADTDIASKASTDTVSELSLPLVVKADYRKNDLDDIVEGVENGTQSSSRMRSSRAALSPSKMKENTSASKVIVIDETNASSLDEDSELGTDSAEGTFSSISSRNSGVEAEGEIIDLTERKEEVPKSLREREYSAGNVL
jgi:hypothetical protein